MQQQGGGSQYGAVPPDMAPFSSSSTAAANRPHVIEHLQQQPPPEAASPISSRPPPPSSSRPPNFEELGGGGGNYGAAVYEDALAAAGEEMERGGVSGNRWPRQETLALLKIRSEMDSAFRDATLKGPLWEDVSRKLAELGYTRSAKKCKEKFENVHKYYKRTKEGRAGRQDGKNYRFFSQLEALHSASAAGASSSATPIAATTTAAAAAPIGVLGAPTMSSVPPVTGRPQPHPMPISSAPPLVMPAEPSAADPTAGISFSSNSSSKEESESDEETEDVVGSGRKRKRSSSTSRKMMSFFDGLMKQVMERQEAMQQRFLETMEKREQDRMIREEAWKRQEMARLTREHDLLAQERSLSASRDSAILSLLQKITGHSIPLPQQQQQPIPPSPSPPPPPPPQPRQPPAEVMPIQEVPPQHEMAIVTTTGGGSGGGFDMASSRWPKSEVHALIKLRSGLETRYQEAGPKGPLWEEISAGMQRLGYNRSSKRCKEKWENINKYFKKVKESNKKRPEDAKTCPYFHQLDALYRKKVLGSGAGSSSGNQSRHDHDTATDQDKSAADVLAIMPLPPQQPPPPTQTQIETETKNQNDENNNKNNRNSDGGGVPTQTSNGGMEEGGTLKKPEDIMKELMEHHQNQQHQIGMDDYDSDNIDGEDDEDDDEDENDKMAYQIQFQTRPPANANNAPSNGGGNVAAQTTTTAGSFLAMVQ
ncbi:Trihelix transcription factor GT-2 [Acorus gramineus]|uniref:Trihelix transcription factor GT-2 n=1 Tax=Acorus gramineus TaxID=55184 RepID=A0AAV9AC16_ACOGR|nr:Trihelix transcription factor GT-2 [Acorus gramineus]